MTVEIVEGAFHGFDLVMPRRPVSLRFFDAQIDAMVEIAEKAREMAEMHIEWLSANDNRGIDADLLPAAPNDTIVAAAE